MVPDAVVSAAVAAAAGMPSTPMTATASDRASRCERDRERQGLR